MIEERTYRKQFSKERFRSFVVNYKDTDLWIGVDPASYQEEMKDSAFQKVKEQRHLLEGYLLKDPVFGNTFDPHYSQPNQNSRCS